jgi:hypothetical protein
MLRIAWVDAMLRIAWVDAMLRTMNRASVSA